MVERNGRDDNSRKNPDNNPNVHTIRRAKISGKLYRFLNWQICKVLIMENDKFTQGY